MSRPRNIPISVTQSDITNGKVGSNESCPIALACKRTLNHAVEVGYASMVLKGDGRIQLPEAASVFIRAFDGRNPVKPFRFKLPLTAEQVAFLKL
jgi:hypothetical protein